MPGGTTIPAPLTGRRVLDLGAFCVQRPHGLAASFAARLCLGFGAEVVRPVPDGGDPLAHAAPLLPNGSSALDRFNNGGKHRGPGYGTFDVVIGDTGALAAHSPSARVCVRISVHGPGEDPPATELSLMAAAGLLGIVGEADGPPARLAGHQPAYAAGLAAFTGLLAALRADGPDTVDVSLFDVAAWLNWKVVAAALLSGAAPGRGGATSDWYTLPAADGHVALVYQDKDWPALRDMVGDGRLQDRRFATRAGRLAHRSALDDILSPWFSARTRAAITRDAQARRIPIGPVLWPGELLDDPQHAARRFIAPGGTPELPVRWDRLRIQTAGMAHAG